MGRPELFGRVRMEIEPSGRPMRTWVMNKLTSLTTGLGLILALTLVSCTVSTQTANDQLPATGNQTNQPGQNPPANNPPATGPVTLSSGMFVTVNDPTSGTAKLIKLENGNHIARLEGFKTANGPDVHVWVSESATVTDAAQRSAVYTDLGSLRSTNGDLNYDIPGTVDISKIKSVIIWCKLVGVVFGGATLK
jgi:hypothetical protein